MFVFLMMLTLYPDGKLTGFAKATKTSGAAKVYWRRLNSKRSLEWTSESEYFEKKIVDISTIYRGQKQSLYPSLRMGNNCSINFVHTGLMAE